LATGADEGDDEGDDGEGADVAAPGVAAIPHTSQ